MPLKYFSFSHKVNLLTYPKFTAMCYAKKTALKISENSLIIFLYIY